MAGNFSFGGMGGNFNFTAPNATTTTASITTPATPAAFNFSFTKPTGTAAPTSATPATGLTGFNMGAPAKPVATAVPTLGGGGFPFGAAPPPAAAATNITPSATPGFGGFGITPTATVAPTAAPPIGLLGQAPPPATGAPTLFNVPTASGTNTSATTSLLGAKLSAPPLQPATAGFSFGTAVGTPVAANKLPTPTALPGTTLNLSGALTAAPPPVASIPTAVAAVNPTTSAVFSFGTLGGTTTTTAQGAPPPFLGGSLSAAPPSITNTATGFAGVLGTKPVAPVVASTLVAQTTAAAPAAPVAPTFTGLQNAPTSMPVATLSTATITSNSDVAGGPSLSVRLLEERQNKWMLELKEQEERFMLQAAHINSWDQVLQQGHDQVQALKDTLYSVKSDQSRLEAELDFIRGQQEELERLLEPLESTVASAAVTHHQGDRQRDNMYHMAQNLDGQLRQMTDDLSKVIEHLNSNTGGVQPADPVSLVARILSAHMDTLKWVDQNSSLLSQKIEEVSHVAEAKI